MCEMEHLIFAPEHQVLDQRLCPSTRKWKTQRAEVSNKGRGTQKAGEPVWGFLSSWLLRVTVCLRGNILWEISWKMNLKGEKKRINHCLLLSVDPSFAPQGINLLHFWEAHSLTPRGSLVFSCFSLSRESLRQEVWGTPWRVGGGVAWRKLLSSCTCGGFSQGPLRADVPNGS